MANTYSQLYVQCVFAVKGRACLLQKPWRDELFKYISGIIKGKGQKPIIVNGVEDHVHIFVGMSTTMTVSELMREVKSLSTKYINDRDLIGRRFSWQEGYGAFTYAHSQKKEVFNYIANQEIHHKRKSFREEYVEFLKEFELEFDLKYLFEFQD